MSICGVFISLCSVGAALSLYCSVGHPIRMRFGAANQSAHQLRSFVNCEFYYIKNLTLCKA